MKKKNIVIIGIILLICLILVFLIVFFHKNDDSAQKIMKESQKYNNYEFVSGKNNADDYFIRDVETLKKEHCVDNVCIKNLVIYYKGNVGTIKYELINKSRKKINSKYKLVFDNDVKVTLDIILKRKESYETVIEYSDFNLSNVYDYSLKKVNNKKGK